MTRHYPDWLTAYEDYAKDDFCPQKFHFWTGVSVLAGTLERRVWSDSGNFKLYPNVYVLLIARPGMGKSTASGIGIDQMLSRLDSDNGKINFIANQNTDASFVQQMTKQKRFSLNGEEHIQSASFFYASEASNSLKEVKGGGDIISGLTDTYDCKEHFSKKLAGQPEPFVITNGCCNFLACSTFEFLARLIPETQIEGGFASRIIYVIQDETLIRTPKWKAEKASAETQQLLLEDLHQIYALAGEFQATPEVQRKFESWFPKQDAFSQGLKSTKMQHFISRKHTNVRKLAMICSASESNSLLIEMKHWERAQNLITDVEDRLEKIIEHSNDRTSQGGINSILISILAKANARGPMNKKDLMNEIVRKGLDSTKITSTLNSMLDAHIVGLESGGYRLLVDAKDYL
jgi:hypothetical protein